MPKKSQGNSKEQKKKRVPWNYISMSGEEFQDKVQEYLDNCEANQRRATKPGLAVFCGISEDTYERWRANKDTKHSRHAAVIKRAEMIMSDRLQQENTAAAIFLMKQPCYGGLTDKQESNQGEHKIVIDILSNGQKVN